MTRVKICGLTRREDALWAADLGADALGFVFATGSRRRADPETVAHIAEALPPFVTTVGVFQDQPVSFVRDVMGGCRLHLAQLHGHEDMEYIRQLGFGVLKAIALSCEQDVEQIRAFPGLGAYLLDTAAAGSGRSFDWNWAARAKSYGRLVLAGGLHPGNVADAIREVQPWAVDAASGTEAAPGIKDREKVRLFIQRAKNARCGPFEP